MIADLEEIAAGTTVLQKGAIPATLPLALADPGNADTLPVIAAEMGRLVYVKLPPQGEQSRAGFPVLLLKIQLAQPLLQPRVADVVGLPFADHRPERLGDHAVLRQHIGQQREVLVPRRGLEGDAGGGDQDGLQSQPTGGPETAVHRPGHQIGIGLTDPRPGVAQGDTALQHGVQHPVAERRLFGALRHVPGGEKDFEDPINFVMGILPVIVGFHPKFPLIGSFFIGTHRILSSTPDEI